MDIRFDQLLLVIMVVLFTLADVVFRRMRRRGGTAPGDRQAEEGEREILDAEVAYGDELAYEDVSVLDEDVFAPPPPEIPPEFRVPPRLPAAPPPPPVRPKHRAVSAPPPVAASRRRAGPLGLDAHEARRAIVLMTVLGPCRGLESDL